MFENIGSFFRRIVKPEQKELGSKDAAKERLHLVLMQDRANVSSEFLELMKQEILDVIKKYIIVDESQIDVRLTNQQNEDGTNGAPSLYANIPIVNIKNEMLVGKVKEFDSKTNSINFGEYKMVIETVSNADGENESIDETTENKEENVVENVQLTEEEKQEAVEEIKEEIKEKIEEVKEALAEEKNLKETEQDDVKEDTIETEEIDSDVEQPVLIFNDNDNDNDSEEKDETVEVEEVEEVKEEIIEKTESEETETDEFEENKDVLNAIDDLDDEEDDDDDVTFDDFLKAAEEEVRLLEEQAKKKDELDSVKVKHNNRNQTNKSKNNKRKGKK